MPQMLQSKDWLGGRGEVRHFHQTGNSVTRESDCSVGLEVTGNLQDSQLAMKMSLSACICMIIGAKFSTYKKVKLVGLGLVRDSICCFCFQSEIS